MAHLTDIYVFRTALRTSTMCSLIATAAFSMAGCDLVASTLPCREGADCAAGDVCGPNARCIAGTAQDGGDLRDDAGGGEPETDGGEPEPGPDPDGGGVTDGGPVLDGGGDDAGGVGDDAGTADGGVIDGGLEDAGDVDGGNIVDAGPVDAGPQSLADALGFNVDTVDLDQFEVPGGLEDWLLAACPQDTVIFDSTANTFDPPACGLPVAQVTTLPNLNGVGDVALLVVSNLDVSTDRRIRLVGDKPVVLVSTSSMSIDGEIDASGFSNKNGAANQEVHGAGGNDPAVCENAMGAPGDETGANEGHGGGGAGHRDPGGDGATARKADLTGAGGVGGTVLAVTGLVGGCRGGDGSGDQGEPVARGQGGAAGGAIHLVANDNISGTGLVTVAGAGGTQPTEKKLGGAGGGSGGTLWVTAGNQLFMANVATLATGGGGSSAAWNEPQGYNPGRESSRTRPVPLGGGMTEALADDVAGRGGVGGSDWGPGDGTRDSNDDKAGGGGGGGSGGHFVVEMLGSGACFVPESAYPVPETTGPCSVDAYCGDGSHDTGEECDLGPFNLAGDVSGCGCRPDCTEVLCPDEDLSVDDIGFVACTDAEACSETSGVGAGRLMHCGENTSCALSCTNDESCTMVCGDNSDCSLACTNTTACNMLCEEDASCALTTCTNSTCAIWGSDDIPPPEAFVDDG